MSPLTEHRPRRGLGVADLLILVAATALSLAWLRAPLERRLTFISDGRVIDNVRPATLVGAAFAVTWGAAVILIRWRHRRQAEEKLRHGPGFLACVAATAAALVKLAALLIWGAFEKFRFESWYVPSILGQLIEPAAIGVLASWLTLWLLGLWRRERTLIDDLGIVVGLSWLGLETVAWAELCAY
jgi:hypothetical protein